MPVEWMGVLEILLKNLTDNLALGIFLGCAVLRITMFFHNTGIGKWSSDHWLPIYLGILFSFCYLAARRIHEWDGNRKSNSRRNKRLHNLTKREKEILAPYIAEVNDFRVRRFLFSDPVAKVLADDGVLSIPSMERDMYGKIAYSIQGWAREYLKDNPTLLGKYKPRNESGDA